MSKLQYRIYIGLLLLCAILALLPFEHTVGQQLTEMLTITLAVYAVARGLNGVISMAQGTELAIEPMGVGVTLAPGEILDPLNDLIEQVSTVLLFAAASLGVQKIMLGIGDINLFRWLLLGLSLIALMIMISKRTPPKLFLNMILILTLLRCVVPMTAIISHQIQNGLAVDRQQAVSVLADTQQKVNIINQSSDENKSWYEGLKESLDITASIEAVEQKAEQAISSAIHILAEFVLVFMLLPILLFMVLFTVFKRLLR